MYYIIMDLEWNQAGDPALSVEALPFEIVEIGAVKLTDERSMVSEFSRLIKPQVYTRMHSITGRLIHLQMEQLMSGDPFTEVYTDFRNWCGDDPVFCTWGPADLPELQRNMAYFGLEPMASAPFAYLDLQKLFAIAFEPDLKQRRSLEYAVDFLKINKDIPFHRAFSDAWYAARVMEKLPREVLSRCSYDVYHLPPDKDTEIHTVFDDYYKYISRAFDDKDEALHDREVMSIRCYLCDSFCRKKIKWFTTNNRHYLAVSECPIHGLVKSKVRLRRNEQGLLYIDKTQRLITEKEMLALKRKREHMLYESRNKNNPS